MSRTIAGSRPPSIPMRVCPGFRHRIDASHGTCLGRESPIISWLNHENLVTCSRQLSTVRPFRLTSTSSTIVLSGKWQIVTWFVLYSET